MPDFTLTIDWGARSESLRKLQDVRQKHEESLKTKAFVDPLDEKASVKATPVDRVYEHGFDPLIGGCQARVGGAPE